MPLVLDGTTGFNLPSGAEIGVGTTAPAGNGLHVDHTAGATLRLTRLGTSTSHFVQLETDGAHGKLQSGGNFDLDVAGNINLDAGTQIILKDDGVNYGTFYQSSSDFYIQSLTQDKDIILYGNAGGSGISALKLDMSNLGFAFFNANAYFNETNNDTDFRIKSVNETNMFYVDASTDRIGIGTSSPSHRLDLVASANAFATRITNNSDGAQGLQVRTSDNDTGEYILDLQSSTSATGTNYTSRFVVTKSGNVGIGTTSAVSSAYDTGSKKLTVMSTTLNNATSGYLELASRANTAGYNAGAIQFNNAENAGTAGTGTQNRTVGQIRTVITTTDSNAGDDSGGTMQFWTKPEAQALANTMRISTDDPNHRVDVTVDATQLAGDGGANANAFFTAKAKGYYYAGLDIKSNDGHVGGWIGHHSGGSTARNLQARVGGNGINNSDYLAIKVDYLGRVTTPQQPAFDAARPAASSASSNLTGWQATYVNRGNHFNASNGRFTAPVAGTYLFYGTAIKNGSTTVTVRYYLVKNSASGYLHNQRHLRLDGGNVNTYGDNGVMTWMVTLAENDWVQAYIGAGTVYTATYEYTIFGGYLLG